MVTTGGAMRGYCSTGRRNIEIPPAIMIMLIASERFLYKMKKNKEEREALQNQTVEAEGAN